MAAVLSRVVFLHQDKKGWDWMGLLSTSGLQCHFLSPLQGYAPPPKNGVEQKRPGRPLNITSLVRLSSAVPNQITVTWAPEIGKVRLLAAKHPQSTTFRSVIVNEYILAESHEVLYL